MLRRVTQNELFGWRLLALGARCLSPRFRETAWSLARANENRL